MNYFIIFISCIMAIEVFIRFNYISLAFSIVKLVKKSINIIFNKNISDHWKEYVIPIYSLNITRYSIKLVLIILLVYLIFFIGDNIFNGLFEILLSPFGIIEVTVLSFGYIYFRKLLIK